MEGNARCCTGIVGEVCRRMMWEDVGSHRSMFTVTSSLLLWHRCHLDYNQECCFGWYGWWSNIDLHSDDCIVCIM